MKKLLVILAFLPVFGFGQLLPDIERRWVSGYQILGSDTCLVDSLTGLGTTALKITFCADQLTNINNGFISAKSFCQLNGRPINTMWFTDSANAHISYWKMSDRIIDGDSIEVLPYRLSDYVSYTSARTGSQATYLKNRFSVPKYPLNPREVGSGKTYTTWAAAVTAMSANDTVVGYSGTYIESALTLSKAGYFYCVDKVTLQTNATRVLTISANAHVYGMIIDGANSFQVGVRIIAGDGDLNNCYLTRFTTGGFKVDAGSSTRTLNQYRCVYQFSGGSASFNRTNTIIEECYFKNSGATFNCYFTNGLGQKQIVRYCKFDGSRNIDINVSNGYNCQFKFNEFKNTAQNFISVGVPAESGTLIVKGNYLNGYTTGHQIFTQCPLFTQTEISYNYGTISSSQTASTGIITIVNNPGASVTFNDIIDNRTANEMIVSITSSGTTMGDTYIQNNTFGSPALTGYCILIGTEATSANNNKISPIISGNLIYGAKFYNSSLDQTTNLKHSIFVGFNKDFNIYNNKCEGGGLAIIAKADGDSNITGNISYNVLKNCYQGIRIKGSKGIKVYNNTVYSNTSDDVYGIYCDINISAQGARGVDIRNNIVLIENSTGGSAFFIDASQIGAFNYNQLMTNGIYASINSITKNYSQLLSDGYNLNGFNSNPLFFSEIQLYPTGNSNAIGNGYDLGVVYETGINPGAEWPNPTTTTQLVNWTIGAYIVEPSSPNHSRRVTTLLHRYIVL